MVDEPPAPVFGVPVGRRAADRPPPSLLAKVNTASIGLMLTLVSGTITAVVQAATRISAAQDHIAAIDREAIDLRSQITKLATDGVERDHRLAAAVEQLARLEGTLRVAPGRPRQ